MSRLVISGLEKSFRKVKPLRGIDLAVEAGDLCAVVGPSGSGKTTLLRTIAGLEPASAGNVALDGERVNDLQPRDRDVAMVAQRPELFQHLKIRENIAFGLRARRMPRAEVRERVERTAELLGLSELLRRYPRHLSDSERQLVAIAHAIARDALLTLLDEPLARLDTPQREAVRGALRGAREERPMTAVFATQDAMEAMHLADRIVLLRDGQVEQQGTPMELFERPASRFVAGFFGPLKMNFLAGTVVRGEGGYAIRLAKGGIIVPLPPGRLPQSAAEGAPVVLGVRPEHMTRAVGDAPAIGTLRHKAEIERLRPAGSRVAATFRTAGEQVIAELEARDVSAPGETVTIDIDLTRAVVFDAETEKAITPAQAEPARRFDAEPVARLDAPAVSVDRAATGDVEHGAGGE